MYIGLCLRRCPSWAGRPPLVKSQPQALLCRVCLSLCLLCCRHVVRDHGCLLFLSFAKLFVCPCLFLGLCL